MPFSVVAWAISVGAVLVSGFAAWVEGNWRRRDGLDIGFAEHAGMWGDLLLLPIANALIVPQIVTGAWLALPLALAAVTSICLHARWHGGYTLAARDHMWPSRPSGTWYRDLSIAGWLHVLYVAGEFGLILAWTLMPTPSSAILVIAAILSVHVPLGLLQPGWMATGRLPRQTVPMLTASVLMLWSVTALKLVTGR